MNTKLSQTFDAVFVYNPGTRARTHAEFFPLLPSTAERLEDHVKLAVLSPRKLLDVTNYSMGKVGLSNYRLELENKLNGYIERNIAFRVADE